MTTTTRRYENTGRRVGECYRRGPKRVTTRKAPVRPISMDSYEVNPQAVAEAIVRRLHAGRS